MAVFFTADTHFGHGAILRHLSRPFRDVAEMDAAMIERWNARVGPDDRVFHLGDFCFKGSKLAERYLERLNGRIVLIQGNHDTENTLHLPRWEAAYALFELISDKTRFVLCHYPLLEWPGVYRGAVHLHGHTHGRLPPTAQRCDVGVDVWDFHPVAPAEILARLATATPHEPEAFYAPG